MRALALVTALLCLGLASCATQSIDDRGMPRSHHNHAAEAAIATPSDLNAHVDAAARDVGVPADMARAVVQKESGYDVNMRGNAGEIGLTQIKPETARAMGYSVREVEHDVDVNLRAGLSYLKRQLAKFSDHCTALSAYNRGENAPAKCTPYGRQVLELIRGN